MTTRGTPSVVGPIQVNQSFLNAAVYLAVVTRREGEHEAATLYVNSSTATIDFDQLPDSRIEFEFGDMGMKSLFQGYVASVTPNRRFVGNSMLIEQEIDCLGASMVMKGNRPRFFTQLTATAMIKRIASENNLGFSDEYRNDNDVWRTLAQTSETDWEMVLALADRISGRIVFDHGVVRLINYLDIAYRQLATRFYTTKNDVSLNDRTDADTGTVVEYVPTNMSVRDPSYRSPTMAYMSGRQAVMLAPPLATSTSDPTLQATQGSQMVTRFATDYPAASQQEAEAYQSGYYTPPWNQEGELRVTGDALMMPGNIVQVASSGRGNTMAANYDGVWYVHGVKHSLGVQGRFFTTLEMGRPPARGSNWYQPRPFWLGDKRGMPVLNPAGSGAWVSSWRAA